MRKKERERGMGIGYSKDSTKGNAIMDPVSYKGDMVINCWVDSRLIAMLSNWLDSEEIRTAHMSEVIKISLEELVNILIENNKTRKIELCQEARDILEFKYRATLNPGNRGRRNLLHNLQLDARRMERGSGLGFMKESDLQGVDYKPIISDEEWDRAQERIKEEEKKEAREQRKEFRQRLSEAGAETGKEFVNGEAEVLFKQPERTVDFSRGVIDMDESGGDKDEESTTNSNDSCQIRKMTDEEVLEKEKDIKLREEKQKEVNDLMMSAPKSGLVEN